MEETMTCSLPDDLLLQILVRLNDVPAALLRCAAVCKRWHRLVTDPFFLRSCWPSSSFLGCITTLRPHRRAGIKGFAPPYFIPPPVSLLGPRRCALTSLVPAASARLLSCAEPLASRHGLLLLRLSSTDANNLDLDPGMIQLAVCNLLTGTCDLLPQLQIKPDDGAVYAILTAADCHPNSEPTKLSFTKVVIINPNEDSTKFNLHTFLSNEECWRVPTKLFDGTEDAGAYGSIRQGNAVVRSSMLHWLFHDKSQLRLCTIDVNIHTDQVCLTELPFFLDYKTTQPCLSLTNDGMFSLVWIEDKGPWIHIWEQRDKKASLDGTPEWVYNRKIQLKEPCIKDTHVKRKLYVLGTMCGMLLVDNGQRHVYTVQLKTGMMEQLVDWPQRHRVNYNETVILEIYWPTIFVSRLLGTRVSRSPVSSLSGEIAQRRRRQRKKGSISTRRIGFVEGEELP